VEPIYIQATQARMPQLKKVVLFAGGRLIYADTYDQALAQLTGAGAQSSPTAQEGSPATPLRTLPGPSQPGSDPRVERIRNHLRRYKELAGQGRWAEAGKELEAIESELK
jgi:uncharacterized protein